MRNLSSHPPPPPPSCFYGYSTKSMVSCTLVSLVLVSLGVFALDSRGYGSWLSSYAPSLTVEARGSGGVLLASSTSFGSGSNISDEGLVEFQKEVNTSDHGSYFSLPPIGAPSPAPEPAAPASEESNISNTRRKRRKDTKLERLELGLARARAAIREAVQNSNRPALADKDYVPKGPAYRNSYAFHRSYLEMEKLLKVYVYEEGEPPIFHDGPCLSIYSTEGLFINDMDMENRLRTRDPDRAHVFFLPFSVVRMVQHIYQRDRRDMSPLRRTVLAYINDISGKYPYWNRSLGADHFMLSCHDWGPYASGGHSHLFFNSIRVLCNANMSEGFNPLKDVSLPEMNMRSAVVDVGGPSASGRPILAFFAGGNHGPVRPVLLKHWKDKDKDMQVHEYLPKGVSYVDLMRKSKFCLCPSGYEVASPRIMEAIYLECVPVTINDHYVLPLSDVLNWKAFSVQVSVEDIPNLKNILMSISPRQYIRMQRRVKIVQRHFMLNGPPKRFDLYHMLLHSIWLRRLNVRIHPQD
ncbi:probable glycosyltransferase At5g03795 [Phoenix dactylifera]|uniref:Probable glycosyltransferase At5g03795 n=1 Tax=Phoenix dactylifera TaxID=42345 RepID=A0A8B7CD36_PHODC|nr:probable glycosyltransferase At5g03795 [Phoenix dactylifera]